MPIQINGRVRGHVSVPINATNKEMEQAALTDPRVKRYLDGSSIRKVIVVPKKLINIVIG
jgi:leucyl-tRNA synthetase